MGINIRGTNIRGINMGINIRGINNIGRGINIIGGIFRGSRLGWGALTAIAVAMGTLGIAEAQLPQDPAAETRAIVQLEGLEVPRARTTGGGERSLYPLEGGLVWTVDVEVGGQNWGFLFDTGASTSLISDRLVNTLQLPGQPVPPDRLQSAMAGDDCAAPQASLHPIPNLNLGGAQVSNLQALQFMALEIPGQMAGVLGMDVLGQFDLQVRPGDRRLTLAPPSPVPESQRDRAIPLTIRHGVPLAQVMIDNQGPFTMLLDTGAESIFLAPHVIEALGVRPEWMREVQVAGFCGLEPAQWLILARVQLGDRTLENLEAVAIDSTVITALNIDGVLGQNFLSAFTQHWHFQQPPERAAGSGPASQRFPEQGHLILDLR
jgi:predicted aspartyl protease